MDGGGEAILQAFLSALRAAGAEVRTGQKVDSILVESGQLKEIRRRETAADLLGLELIPEF